jgi:cell division protein FtsN
MVAKRGKKQARRSGESSVPGYVWLLSGLLIGGAVAVTLYVKMPHAIDDLMPHPNLTAKPAVANDSSAAAEGNPAASPAASSALAEPKKPKFTFYALLPEKEVIIPDEELSAQVKAEAAANLASKQQATPAAVPGVPANPPTAASPNATNTSQASGASTAATTMHAGSNASPATSPTKPPVAPTVASATPQSTATDTSAAPTAPAADTTSDTPKSGQYLLQAGAFRNDKQADDLKARIAMLGLIGRVEVVQTPAGEMHRVRLGPYATASELEQAKQKLAGGGLPAVAIRVK